MPQKSSRISSRALILPFIMAGVVAQLIPVLPGTLIMFLAVILIGFYMHILNVESRKSVQQSMQPIRISSQDQRFARKY
ncbi:hypothetical protein KAR48_19325 [bacterium]|nr:hypothetical protein [bacterium]